jgi:Zn-dependent peptidase ImmA (M78 family)
VSVWQKRLNLEAWNVSIEVVPRAALRPGTIGNVKWEPKAKTACIRVMQSADYDRSPEEALEDMEFTVIHELVHLQKDGGAEDEVDAVVYSLLLAKDDGQLSHQQGH